MSDSRPEKVIAIVMAGGTTPEAFGADRPAFKSLVSIHGKPLVEYTIAALEKSCVRQVYVFHDDSNVFREIISGYTKTSFVPRPETARSFAEGIRFALETVVNVMGLDIVRNRLLLFLPCDLPLITAESIDGLIDRSRSVSFDLAYTIAAHDLMKAKYPEKQYRKHYLADLGAHYLLQTPSLLNGQFIRRSSDGEGITFGPWSKQEIDDLAHTITSVRTGRHGRLFALKFVYKMFFRRLARTGQRRLLFEVVLRYLTRRFRSTDLNRLTEAIFQTKTAPIDSMTPEFSADIDQPDDIWLYFPD